MVCIRGLGFANTGGHKESSNSKEAYGRATIDPSKWMRSMPRLSWLENLYVGSDRAQANPQPEVPTR
jgi:hypothetical protein